MKFIGAISALYLGIYLILPGCLCQLLEVCGIQVHATQRPAHECVIQDGSVSVPCHCHGMATKAVDLEFATVVAPELPKEATPLLLPEKVLLIPASPAEIGRSRAPPPPPKLPSSTLRIFTGVFQV